jgi:hypothetical protein
MGINIALWMLGLQGLLGAFDTVYYHEWRGKLPGRGPFTHPELKLHAARDFVYAILLTTLPYLAWDGFWAIVLTALLLAEIVFTLADFVVEEEVRRPRGGLYQGERVMHAIMGIAYGAMLAYLVPVLAAWYDLPSGFTPLAPTPPTLLRWLLMTMGIGVFVSGVRDLCSVLGVPYCDWPWHSVNLK